MLFKSFGTIFPMLQYDKLEKQLKKKVSNFLDAKIIGEWTTLVVCERDIFRVSVKSLHPGCPSEKWNKLFFLKTYQWSPVEITWKYFGFLMIFFFVYIAWLNFERNEGHYSDGKLKDRRKNNRNQKKTN